jgi:antitoxin PrlF
MAKKKNLLGNVLNCGSMGCCKIDAMLSVDERGQMILPKDIRDKAGIKAGDKLAAISWEQGGRTSCIVLIKTENLTEMVKEFLGPVFKDVFQKKE